MENRGGRRQAAVWMRMGLSAFLFPLSACAPPARGAASIEARAAPSNSARGPQRGKALARGRMQLDPSGGSREVSARYAHVDPAMLAALKEAGCDGASPARRMRLALCGPETWK